MKIRDEIVWLFYCVALGASLVVYAHANFATKSSVEKLDDRVYDIWKEVVPVEKQKRNP